MADLEQEMIIRRFGGNSDIKKHLEDLGFHIGGSASVVSKLGNNIFVKVKESKVAVSEVWR